MRRAPHRACQATYLGISRPSVPGGPGGAMAGGRPPTRPGLTTQRHHGSDHHDCAWGARAGEGQARPHGKEGDGGRECPRPDQEGPLRHGPQFQGRKVFYQVRRKHRAPRAHDALRRRDDDAEPDRGQRRQDRRRGRRLGGRRGISDATDFLGAARRRARVLRNGWPSRAEYARPRAQSSATGQRDWRLHDGNDPEPRHAEERAGRSLCSHQLVRAGRERRRNVSDVGTWSLRFMMPARVPAYADWT